MAVLSVLPFCNKTLLNYLVKLSSSLLDLWDEGVISHLEFLVKTM